MRRLWITIVVLALLGAGVAVGQPGDPVALAAATDAAQGKLTKDQRERAALAATKATLAKRYDAELAAIDRLKQQRKSWRRERQLQDAQAKALDTSKELATLSQKIATRDAAIAADKRALVAAIDAELPSATGARKTTITATRAAAVPRLAAKAHKIVVPDGEIDPLADPEELDQQATAMRASEAELAKQVDALDAQTKRLVKAAELRKAHDRAGDLASRDDDAPRRGGTGTAGGTRGPNALGEDANGAPQDGSDGLDPGDGEAPPLDDMDGFTGDETAVVLAEVIDPSTGDALRKAGRTSDPATKAEAAKRARKEVAAKLEALKKQRAAVEARAKELRKK
jgi:hypothetical protein